MPVLEKAWCCLKLETGTAISGWLSAIVSIIDTIASIVAIAKWERQDPLFIILIIGICQLIISGLLIHGAMTRNRKLIMPWLIGTIINVAIMNILILYATCSIFSISILIYFIIVDLLVAYLWTIVYSFNKELEVNPGGHAF